MKDKLVSFDTAKLAKEKGFSIPTQKAYIEEELFVNFEESYGEREFYFNADDFYENWNKKDWLFNKRGNECFGCKLDNRRWFEAYSAPTQSLLQKYIREEFKLHIVINITIDDKWYFEIYNLNRKRNSEHPGYDNYLFDSFEEALETALYESLKLIEI